MTVFQAIILGIVQGATEYLPVSSSAHLVLVPSVLGWHFGEKEAFIFDVLVQLGTLIGVFAYFFQDILTIIKDFFAGIFKGELLSHEGSRTGIQIIVATIPATVIGLAFKSFFESFFSSARFSAMFLIVTAFLLVFAEWLKRAQRNQVSWVDSVIMGFAQALAIFPGISRSGSTIAFGMISGLTRPAAARFSFLMSIPVMIGASLIAGLDLAKDFSGLSHMLVPVIAGFCVSAVTGYIVIKWFLDFLKHRSLVVFSLYCLVAGVLGLMYL